MLTIICQKNPFSGVVPQFGLKKRSSFRPLREIGWAYCKYFEYVGTACWCNLVELSPQQEQKKHKL